MSQSPWQQQPMPPQPSPHLPQGPQSPTHRGVIRSLISGGVGVALGVAMTAAFFMGGAVLSPADTTTPTAPVATPGDDSSRPQQSSSPEESASVTDNAAIDVTWQSFPEEFLGRTRADLEGLESGKPDVVENTRLDSDSMKESYVRSYGGPGAQMNYGMFEGRAITLTATAGRIPGPLNISNARIERYASIPNSVTVVAVEDTGDVNCGVAPEIPAQLAGADSPDALRRQVLEAQDGYITCVVTNPQGSFSVEARMNAEEGTSAEQQARIVAVGLEEVMQEMYSQ